MQELRALELADVGQGGDQHVKVVAVDGADIVEAEFLEQGARRDHALDMFLGAFCQLQDGWRHAQHLFCAAAHGVVHAAGQQPGQVIVERPDRGRDRHVVVVEDDQQIGIHGARVVECLKGHARRHRAIADDGYGAGIRTGLLGSHGHAERRGDGGAGMAGAKGVVCAFRPSREAGDAAFPAQPGHAAAAPRQDLVRVGLVAYVPDQAVIRGVEHVVQRNGEFHHPQVGRQMSSGLRYAFDEKGAQLRGQLRQLPALQQAQLGGKVDAVKQSRHQ
ncbi:hypothetical protein GALL_419200 [mine drainage metagenome]|uniref:Uncharacterized protein n=1 Tax=mine drainage metagenome TaxID=410659 RepID=A0A1J5PZA2_9ZZZZ